MSNVNGDTIKKREFSYVEQVNELVCENILGSPGNKEHWAVPLEKEKGAQTHHIGTINMENYRMIKIIENAENLLSFQFQIWREEIYGESVGIVRSSKHILFFA